MSKPTVPEVLDLCYDYYAEKPEHCAWGSLHIVLEDGNLHDADVQFCINNAREKGDASGMKIAEMILKMSKSQRARLRYKLSFAGRNTLLGN